ncbi:hypothetical protein BDV95DRAFT_583844 [Massariosphaeria phaeospora]|uniref:Uncharacterized protein n=1 Tax=Massariosphaeria phaeospora TaxID=100035 RepID=A0A7C8M340_9PLEO|nr:hypothetical protein BDV95DRAFT_583844 [Massariosphaeria phaeospora]
MSTHQKSFFDQGPKPKYFKGSWQRPRNASGNPHQNDLDAPPRHVVTGPPIMPSSQTRTKLKAFQFVEGAPTLESIRGRQAEKENIPVQSRRNPTPNTSKAIENVPQKTFGTPKLAQSKICPPPSTPATRLPLADLVGNIDDSTRHVVKPVLSPDEQLCWRGSQPVSTPFRRGKKRARSSSPAAPSQEEPKMDSVRRELDTPQADPATELWTRYTGNKDTPSANKAVTFAHLINESSPRSSVQAGSVSGLRRWASCGVEFPTSTTKRRRTHGGFRAESSNTDDVFNAASSDGALPGQPEKSNLAGMLQRMRDSISRPPPIITSSVQPGSSSPLPEAADRDLSLCESPLRQRPRDQFSDASGTFEEDMEAIDEDKAAEEARRSSASSDEFGDADFDTDMVEALEITQDATEQFDTPVSAPIGPPHPTVKPQQSDIEPESVFQNGTDSDDEFGDDDLLAADLEHVASLYDSRAEESFQEHEALPDTGDGNVLLTNNITSAVIDLVDDDDEDFGDDIDVDEFAAAEVAATQTPANTVCRSRTYP